MAAWTAPPDAPLARLSIAQIAMTVPVRSSKRAVTWAMLLPSVALVDGEASLTYDERLVAVVAGQRVEQRRPCVTSPAGPGVAGGQDAPVHRREVRGEQHLGADLLLDLRRVAVVEQAVGGEVLVDACRTARRA